jgi:hypothetical protein
MSIFSRHIKELATIIKMKIRSIPHIWAVVTGLILLFGPFYLIFGLLSRLYSNGETIPKEGYFAVGFFVTLGFWIILMLIYFVKIITISNDRIKIIYPFRLKSYDYNLSEIIMHKVYHNFGVRKNYETLHFQTIDNKLFMIMQFEYWNFKTIKDFVVNNTKTGEISKYHNLKVVLIVLVISIALAIGLIVIFKGIIK